jgi:hypothetical protein
MASSTFSPDGEWMWDGNQWIPAPPNHSSTLHSNFEPNRESENPSGIETQNNFGSNMNKPLQTNSSSNKVLIIQHFNPFVAQWIGALVIFLSLMLPYISIIGLWEYSGFEMISEIMNLFEFDSSNTENYPESISDDNEVSFVYSLAILMFLFSPIVFLLSAVLSGSMLLSNKSPKFIGTCHMLYSTMFFVFVFLHKANHPYDVTIFEILGEGFYCGALASILLMIEQITLKNARTKTLELE